MNDYYTASGNPVAQSRGASSVQRAEFNSVEDGFDKVPAPSSLWADKANYGVDTGAADAYIVTIASTYNVAYTDGMTLKVKALNANTGASTINVNSLGVKTIVRPEGTALQANDIVSGQVFQITYNSTSGKFQLANAYGGPPGPTGTLAGNATAGINWLQGPNIASAATTMDIWRAAQGNLMTVTGTTTTTGLPAAPQAGAERWLVADGAWPITADANLLIAGVASGQTITLAAGDLVVVRALTTTQFRCLVFRASGTPAVAGLMHVRDEKTSGTAGGSLTANAWNVRTLNTVVTNTIAGASLASDQVTLPAGTYDIEAHAPTYSATNTYQARLKLTNVTDTATAALGMSGNHNAYGATNRLRQRVTLAAQKVLQLEQFISLGVTVTGGEPVSQGAEYYSELIIEKVAA